VDTAFENLAGGRNVEALDLVGDAIYLRRHPGGARKPDEWPIGEARNQRVVIEFEAANARREHGSYMGKCSALRKIAKRTAATDRSRSARGETAGQENSRLRIALQ